MKRQQVRTITSKMHHDKDMYHIQNKGISETSLRVRPNSQLSQTVDYCIFTGHRKIIHSCPYLLIVQCISDDQFMINVDSFTPTILRRRQDATLAEPVPVFFSSRSQFHAFQIHQMTLPFTGLTSSPDLC